jgi:hypothetical protein
MVKNYGEKTNEILKQDVIASNTEQNNTGGYSSIGETRKKEREKKGT